MPFAFSDRSDLSSDGYNDPDDGEFVFLGFAVDAPFFINEIEDQINASYYFVVNFYDSLGNASHPHIPVNTALDLASNEIWGVNWDLCPLYQLNDPNGDPWGEMRVYGNGNWTIILPGDVDHDAYVGIYDLTRVSKAYGSVIGDPKYDPDADLTGDGRVDVRDLAIVSKNYGRST